MHGGKQESSLRGGTENVASIVGMSIALKNNVAKLKLNNLLYEKEQFFIFQLDKRGVMLNRDFLWNGNNKIGKHLPGLISLSFKGKDGETIMHRMDLKGITISTGAACDSIHTQISHVIKAIKVPIEYVMGTIRISLGNYITLEELEILATTIQDILQK